MKIRLCVLLALSVALVATGCDRRIDGLYVMSAMGRPLSEGFAFHRNGKFEAYNDYQGVYWIKGEKITVRFDTSEFKGNEYTGTIDGNSIRFEHMPIEEAMTQTTGPVQYQRTAP